jgi:hypothetical protein
MIQSRPMDILAVAKAERDRLNKVIAILEPEAPTATPTKSKGKPRGRHQWTEAERKAMSIKQKALWAKKKVKKAA